MSLTAWAVLPRVRLDTEDPEAVFDETARLPGIAERNSEVELDELDESSSSSSEAVEVVEVVEVDVSSLEQPVINKAKQRVLINTKYTVRIVPPNLKMNIIFISNDPVKLHINLKKILLRLRCSNENVNDKNYN